MSTQESRWRIAIERGEIGVWDLDPMADTVHYAPHWKECLGFAALNEADSTAFWRCRVHPDDLAPMLRALRAHLDGDRSTYEMSFRLRSNGSGYRQVLSRGRAVQRDARGHATRMVGTMIDLTGRPVSPAPQSLTALDRPRPTDDAALPFHALLGVWHPSASRQRVVAAGAAPRVPALAAERETLLAQVEDLLDEAVGQVAVRP